MLVCYGAKEQKNQRGPIRQKQKCCKQNQKSNCIGKKVNKNNA